MVMPENDPVHIISDSPEKSAAVFGFDGYARTIAGLIANRKNKTPMTIGIYGPWGSGKTTLMENVRGLLSNRSNFKNRDKFRKCKTVWFQAWKHGQQDEILAALIQEIFIAMKQDGFLTAAGAEIEALIKTLKPFRAFEKMSESITGVNVADLFSELEHKKKLGFYDSFQEFFDRLLWTYLELRPKMTSLEKPDDEKGALVVFIDDLDRCPQPRIVQVLETVKLFMDKPGCIFVIGADNDIIEKALTKEYGKEDARRFMEKIVQVSFNLPRIPTEDFAAFVERLSLSINSALHPHLNLIMPALQHNPRQLKRFVNNLNLLDGLLKNSGVEIDFNHLLFWGIILHVYPNLARDISDNPENLYELRKIFLALDEKIGDRARWEIGEEALKGVPQSFHTYLKDRDLVRIVSAFDIPRPQFEQLRTFSGTIERVSKASGSVTDTMSIVEGRGRSDSPMVEIEAGPFKYGPGAKPATIEKLFSIDVYPVTNSQFEAFIKDGGYEKERLWHPDGWKWRQQKDITVPDYWEDEKWNPPDHPVVGVSWYEADAFARWSKKRLPTEQEWERAARGIDGRVYPWGNEFDKEKCNTKEAGLGRTTRVSRYPGGISPDGCYDMAGNVLEWTTSFYDEIKGLFVIRGGSWSNNQDNARCAGRNNTHPIERCFVVGFRCVRTKK